MTTDDLRRVLAGEQDPLKFACDLFRWWPDDDLRPLDLAYDTYPAPALAGHALTAADWIESIAAEPYFEAGAEAGIAVEMLRGLAQWLRGERHDPVPAMIAGIIDSLPELMETIVVKYDAGFEEHFWSQP